MRRRWRYCLPAYVALALCALFAFGVAAVSAAPPSATSGSATPSTSQPTASADTGTSVSAAAIDFYLTTHDSPMVGQGAAFIAAGGAWGVDPRLLVAIAGAESDFGAITCGSFNAWGYGCPTRPYQFTSWADGIDHVAQGLRQNYFAAGLTSVAQVGARWAPIGASNDPTNLNSAWATNVTRFLVEQGGSPFAVDTWDTAGAANSTPFGLTPADVDPAAFAALTAASQPRSAAPEVVEVAPGASAVLTIDVRNTGEQSWTADTVRLERVDDDQHLTSAPYAALVTHGAVATGAVANFAIDVTGQGLSSADVATEWRLVGPTGVFGDRIVRVVQVRPSVLSQTAPAVYAPATLAPGTPGLVEVRLRNNGSQTWQRDGAGHVLLGVQTQSGANIASPTWLSPTVPAGLLERSVAPGETGTFAFRVVGPAAGTSTTLQLKVFVDAGSWADGPPVALTVGASAVQS